MRPIYKLINIYKTMSHTLSYAWRAAHLKPGSECAVDTKFEASLKKKDRLGSECGNINKHFLKIENVMNCKCR